MIESDPGTLFQVEMRIDAIADERATRPTTLARIVGSQSGWPAALKGRVSLSRCEGERTANIIRIATAIIKCETTKLSADPLFMMHKMNVCGRRNTDPKMLYERMPWAYAVFN